MSVLSAITAHYMGVSSRLTIMHAEQQAYARRVEARRVFLGRSLGKSVATDEARHAV